MSRIPTPPDIAAAPTASRDMLTAVTGAIGSVPNLFRLVATSPAALEGQLAFDAALKKGTLDPATRERFALRVADRNGCDYCDAAHSYIGAHMAKLTPAELAANRDGRSDDPKADAALRFATALMDTRGHVDGAVVEAARAGGLSDAEMLEVVGHVALNTFNNSVNSAFGTEIDFPAPNAVAAE